MKTLKYTDIVGNYSVKWTLECIYELFCDKRIVKNTPLVLAFVGKPSSCKKTCCQILAGMLHEKGYLKSPHPTVVNALNLIAEEGVFNEVVQKASDYSILYIEDAQYLIKTVAFGMSGVSLLLDTIEQNNIPVVLAFPDKQTLEKILNMDSRMYALLKKDPVNRILNFSNLYNEDQYLPLMRALARSRTPQIGLTKKIEFTSEFERTSFDILRKLSEVSSYNRKLSSACIMRYLKDCVDFRLAATNVYSSRKIMFRGIDDIPQEYRELIKDFPIFENDLNQKHISLKECEEGTVFIRAEDVSGKSKEATGFIITSSGIVLTCAHVLEDVLSVAVRVECPGSIGGDRRWFWATIQKIDKEHDIALLKLDGYNFVSLPIRREEVKIGENIFILGFVCLSDLFDDANRTSAGPFHGRVSSVQEVDGVECCCLDTKLYPDMSGGPVFDEQKRVVGYFCGTVKGTSCFLPIKHLFRHIRCDYEYIEEDRDHEYCDNFPLFYGD